MVAATGKFDEVASLLVEQLAIARDEITPESRIVEDLRCDGDDADELMIAYAERFDVDMSNYFFLDHFDWEGDSLTWGFWLHLSCLVSRRVREAIARGEARIAPVRIWHLVHCAETKIWQHPDEFDPAPRTPLTTSAMGHLIAVAWRLPFVLMFCLIPAALLVGALAAPTLPWGLVALAGGLLIMWGLFGTMRAAVHYYADRKSSGSLKVQQEPA